MSTKRILLLIMISVSSCAAFSQKKAPAKYPSLFWEITGNGLQKPSYLFGTMHVSSKMVFHLSDSFYFAIKNVDAVALELNPDLVSVNIDLRKHYLLWGLGENRRYRRLNPADAMTSPLRVLRRIKQRSFLRSF